ncbi:MULTISPECIES: OsmC family protein [Rhodopirellula]|uniref:OsmC family protein n=1 Tax=Rhodopirellula europaea 6C TaxID=1263867 RepID=M2B4G9_9BACT|nr:MULTISPECIES: OsmC family protein [Rhodopirellula]EMB16643.1 OsmC family protein [Rhodopirellula europaea 6C]|tara:strand:+ start:49 stop:468 length:420 start_codon:yes stop_codon:yes gene_type:complete
MSVEITAVYQGQLHCEATHGPSGTKLVTDAPTDNGGRGSSFSPSDLVATALGTCVMTIMGLVADRHELDLSGTTIRVEKEMASTPVRRIASLKTKVTFPAGLDLQPEMRDRLVAAARKCPVHQSLHPDIDAPIDFVDLD